ncbi:MAG: ChbG/HpnK family deacetylase [Anaeromyxobacteraceae bacterium]|nr:ChbG/HpnK family deacetylase [Anaeromyxobacteraceae bacterium]
MTVLVINADDFGYSRGINRGIVEAHDRGVVTSTSLMVDAPRVEEAVALARTRPALSVGLHVNFTNEAERLVEFTDPAACRADLLRQVARFEALVGRPPTHLDSHQHVHRGRTPRPIFREVADRLGVHLRDEPPVVYKGGFYGQWEHGVSEPDKIGVPFLARMLREEFASGAYELCVHPGYFDDEATFVYHRDREVELATLTDPAIRAVIDGLGIRLVGWAGLAAALAAEEVRDA